MKRKVAVAINGFGRIGRLAFRAAVSNSDIDIVAINDLTDAQTLAHLLTYDSTHGRFPGEVRTEGDHLVVGDSHPRIFAEADPARLPWGDLGVEVVLESTGFFTRREQAEAHITAGARKVLISAPAQGEDATIVLGVNDDTLKPEHSIISNASCTTNCLAPMVKILHDEFGVIRGMMNTIHSYTNDQRILDLPHKDLRRARAGAVNMIPTTTGAAIAVGKVIPELQGKLDGLSIRVPTPNGSLTDLTVELKRSVSKENVNDVFKVAAAGHFKGYVEYSEEPLVLSDIVGNPASCVFDALSTMVLAGNLVKLLGWYDNEWGYANRCVDLIPLLAN